MINITSLQEVSTIYLPWVNEWLEISSEFLQTNKEISKEFTASVHLKWKGMFNYLIGNKKELPLSLKFIQHPFYAYMSHISLHHSW